jgi:hypothetical protein
VKYRDEEDRKWVTPRRRDYRMMCCDCGLVHSLDFRIVSGYGGKQIQFRATRLDRSTSAARRAKRFKRSS